MRLHPANASSCPAVVVRNTTDCGASCAGVAVAPLVPSQVTDGFVWILESIVPGKVHSYSIECRTGPLPSAVHGVAHPPKIFAKVERRGAAYILSNPTVRLAIAAVAGAGHGTAPPPFQGMTVDGPAGTLVGGSFWNTSLGILSFESQVEASGPVFARVSQRYMFKDGGNVTFSVRLAGGDSFATFDEHFNAGKRATNDAWMLDLSSGVVAEEAVMISTHTCDMADPYSQPVAADVTNLTRVSLLPNRRLGNSLGYLFHRWNQGCDAKIAVGTHSTSGAGLAVLAARGGLWRWPVGTGFSFSELGASIPTITVNASGTFLGLRFPTYAPEPDTAGGRRVYFIASYGSDGEAAALPSLLQQHSWQPLDKLLNEFVLWWPGVVSPEDTTNFSNYIDDNATNPTHMLRGLARSLNADIIKGELPSPTLATLVTVNQMFDPDWYGLYRGFTSPENNNFATDFIRPAMLTAVGLVARQHPCSATFTQLVTRMFQSDLFHSITMPSGATQEAPGYLAHALDAWLADAPIYRQYFGFDPLTSPRLCAGVAYLFQLAHPFNFHVLGDAAADPSSWRGRYIVPIGDTHPNSVNYSTLQQLMSFTPPPVHTLTSVELEGFGVVLRSQPGTMSETFLSFKAGPNQGHDHGDQLSIHWCAYGRRHAIDLLFGYKPRPLQEYWHNRMSFGIDGVLHNMDGFARLVAMRFSPAVDVAVGVVSSDRLRRPPQAPPGIWGANYPWYPLGGLLNYTRTTLLLKMGAGRDYVVLHDVFSSPRPLSATLNQWYMQDGNASHAVPMANDGHVASIDMGNSTLFVLALDEAVKLTNFSTVRWANSSEGNEHATGVRITAENTAGTAVVSLLYPPGSLTVDSSPIPVVSLAAPGVIRVAHAQGGADVLTFGGRDNRISLSRMGKPATVVLAESDVDFDRNQGNVGLTTLDAGHDFGRLPDWLVAQRLSDQTYE